MLACTEQSLQRLSRRTMRVRTGRFEKLRLKETGHTQAVKVRDREHLVESRLTVMPPALDSSCRHNGQLMGRTHLENLTVYRSAAFPVLELNRPKSVANPRIEDKMSEADNLWFPTQFLGGGQ